MVLRMGRTVRLLESERYLHVTLAECDACSADFRVQDTPYSSFCVG